MLLWEGTFLITAVMYVQFTDQINHSVHFFVKLLFIRRRARLWPHVSTFPKDILKRTLCAVTQINILKINSSTRQTITWVASEYSTFHMILFLFQLGPHAAVRDVVNRHI